MELDKISEGSLGGEGKLPYNHVYCFIIGLKKLKVKIIEKRKGKKKEEKEKENSTELQKPT